MSHILKMLPKKGTRGDRVLIEMAKHPVGPIAESVLMAAHGTDQLHPAIWRNGPYRLLIGADLIEAVPGGYWVMTDLARTLLRDAAFDLARQIRLINLVPLPAANMATARYVPPFRPKPAPPPMRETRPGALDYKTIPSVHARPTTLAL